MGHKQSSGADEARRAERARDVGLFRYALIRAAADSGLTTRQRGRMVRELAEAEHVGPCGDRVRVSRVTLDRWIRAWRAGGFDALVPSTRHAEPHTPASVLELAAALKREVPGRTAAQVAAILAEHAPGSVCSARTLQRHFARLELNTRPDGSPPAAFGRFEAAAPNVRWTGDALHGPVVAGRKAYLFAFIDDHSRLLTGYRWGHSEDTVRLEAALRNGMTARGIPKVVYLDNGSAMVSKQLLRALAILGIVLTHSRPGQPAGRGKIERFFRTVREQFLIELAAPGALRGIETLTEFNELFTAWVETVYHQRVHSETGQTPLARFTATDPPPLPTPAVLHEAFLWSEQRLVTKTATVSLHGNTYEVDAALVGRRVELVFDPFDLTCLSVRYAERDMGIAVPHQIGRHVHPAAKTDTSPYLAPQTGIDYLGLVRDRHTAALTQRVNYAGLVKPEDRPDGQLEAELAAFQTLGAGTGHGDVGPDQLDLLTLIDDLAHLDHDPQEHQ
ncbi:MAG: DDE-type integrase/transposase/recombinase [Marmoricola sp.]